MRNVIFVFVLFMVLGAQAQDDLYTKKSIAIPSAKPTSGAEIKKEETPKEPSKTFPLYKIDYNKRSFSNREELKDIGFYKTDDFVKPGQKIKKELNQDLKGEDVIDMTIFRRHQLFGEIRNNGEKVNIMYRDHMAIDGDMIRVWLNDKVIMDQITLIGSFQGVDLKLQKGFNKIEFEAINQGSSGPNTAEFFVYDDKGILISSNRWDLATGFKASFIIVKE